MNSLAQRTARASWLLVAGLLLTACASPTPTAIVLTSLPPPAPTTPAPVGGSTAAAAPSAPGATPTPRCPPPIDASAINKPETPKSVAAGWTQEPNNLNPYYAATTYAWQIAQLTLVGLAEWDAEGRFVPELAAEAPTVENGGISPDGLTITWKLKDCLFWSDGQRLTSADVKFTWDSIRDPRNAVFSIAGYDKIESIETPDELTAVIHFSELYPQWQTLFTQGPNNAGAILPEHLLRGKTGLESNPEIRQPSVVSGPFRVAEWVAGDHITLVANPNFYKGPPKLDQVEIKFIPDSETALEALKTGYIDWYSDFFEADIPTLSALEPEVHLAVSPGVEFEQYVFNLGTTTGVNGQGQSDQDGFCPFLDARVRKAIILGINRQAIVEEVLQGKTNVPATQWPNSEWTNSALQPEPYDPDQAMALLEQAGYTDQDGDGVREGECNGELAALALDLQTTTRPIRQQIAQMVQADLQKIGVALNPIHIPASALLETYHEGGPLPAGSFQIAGYALGYFPDPYTDTWRCDQIPSEHNDGAGGNYYHYCDPALDQLFAAVNATADPAARKRALDEAQKYIYDKALVALLYSHARVVGYTDRFLPAPFGFLSHLTWNAEAWEVK